MHKRSGIRPYSCNLCTFRCFSAESLHSHLSLHSRSFTSKNVDRNDDQFKTSSNPYQCSHCNFKCIELDSFLLHRKEHVQLLQQRLMTIIKRSANDNVLVKENKTRFSRSARSDRQHFCSKCSFKCDSLQAFSLHMEHHQSNQQDIFSCSICDYSSNTKAVVIFHEKNHHLDVPLTSLCQKIKLQQEENNKPVSLPEISLKILAWGMGSIHWRVFFTFLIFLNMLSEIVQFSLMDCRISSEKQDVDLDKESIFGQRFLNDETRVFEYNAWDDVDWPDEKEKEIKNTIELQQSHPVDDKIVADLLDTPNKQWETFYLSHGNKFFMNRKWVIREFSELFSEKSATDGPIRILDVGCGVGNTTIPIIQATSDSNLFIYCCDYSKNAVELLRSDKRVPTNRCHPFVWDITENTDQVPEESLDYILCVFVLSAIAPCRLKLAILNLVRLLKPGGILMVKDYGRYDLTQLRFKRDRFIDENFYRRGDGTFVSYFTTEELHALFAQVGLERIQNIMEKRLNKRKLLKLCCEVAKYRPLLLKLYKQRSVSNYLLKTWPNITCDEALFLLYEFTFGRLGMKRDGNDHQLTKLERKGSVDHLTVQSEASLLPRYARVNPLREQLPYVLDLLKDQGWTVRRLKKMIPPLKYRKLVARLEPLKCYIDPHIDNLLIFPRGTDLHDHILVKQGVLILQDKASCFPAFLLSPQPGSFVMDVCAAPGMKTTHLAALMKNKGKIFAFDRNAERLNLLRKMSKNANARIIQAQCIDFLQVDVNEFTQVEYALVDPPCSGSGMVKRGEFFDEFEQPNTERIKSLANLQAMILKHALRLPSLRRLVYSTCSINWAENEGVIFEVLEDVEISDRFILVNAFNQWKHRGELNKTFNNAIFTKEAAEEIVSKCMRASPKIDFTNGFFIAIFERRNKYL
uniref:SAM-dependent MTase RsmB/NOP-type domain-containing protein n=1 Tax=Meloidogyne floridensis TaxID=298350 RepID=A0A915P8C5_9BILA